MDSIRIVLRPNTQLNSWSGDIFFTSDKVPVASVSGTKEDCLQQLVHQLNTGMNMIDGLRAPIGSGLIQVNEIVKDLGK